jgi:hypothetical protein
MHILPLLAREQMRVRRSLRRAQTAGRTTSSKNNTRCERTNPFYKNVDSFSFLVVARRTGIH